MAKRTQPKDLNSRMQNVHISDEGEAQSINFSAERVIGNGSFGVVFQARDANTGETVAIKKVLQDRRFKNRELQIMRTLDHCNVVKLKQCFYSNGDKPDEVYLNLVMEFVSDNLHRVCRSYARAHQQQHQQLLPSSQLPSVMPLILVKLYMYQLCRALNYIHSKGVCHRDIKPQNILVDTDTHVLKLCDFGSAKMLVSGENNVSYICSRYYRAPELIFGASQYETSIDMWSMGCVLCELILGQPLFPGESAADQLVEIIKVLGTPTRDQIRLMNKNYTDFRFPQVKPHPWFRVFGPATGPDTIDLISKILVFEPTKRLTPLQACAHPFFDELRDPKTTLPNGNPLPVLFNYTRDELRSQENLKSVLVPDRVLHLLTPEQLEELNKI